MDLSAEPVGFTVNKETSLVQFMIILEVLTVLMSVKSVNSHRSVEKILLFHKYFRNLHKTNTIVFLITFAVKQARYHMSSTTNVKVSFFGYVIYSSADTYCWQYMSAGE